MRSLGPREIIPNRCSGGSDRFMSIAAFCIDASEALFRGPRAHVGSCCHFATERSKRPCAEHERNVARRNETVAVGIAGPIRKSPVREHDRDIERTHDAISIDVRGEGG
jgi:hypothetical protein